MGNDVAWPPYAVAEQCVCVSLCVCGDERVYCTCYSYDLTQPRFSALCSDTRAPSLSSSSQSVTPPRFNKPCCSWFCCCYCCRGDANILVGINRDHKPKALFLLWEAGSGNKKKQFLKQERRMFDTKEQKLDQTQREANSGFIIKTVESACFSLRCSSCALYCLWCSLTWTCLPFTCLVEPSYGSLRSSLVNKSTNNFVLIRKSLYPLGLTHIYKAIFVVVVWRPALCTSVFVI